MAEGKQKKMGSADLEGGEHCTEQNLTPCVGKQATGYILQIH